MARLFQRFFILLKFSTFGWTTDNHSEDQKEFGLKLNESIQNPNFKAGCNTKIERTSHQLIHSARQFKLRAQTSYQLILIAVPTLSITYFLKI